ncbi:MAG TPA: hypothetical protein VFN37_12520 [Candidatus Baltobacteraceae bacterium]|nr:hypothetical protein [Candidatus Baltobacteraceae bacterium]
MTSERAVAVVVAIFVAVLGYRKRWPAASWIAAAIVTAFVFYFAWWIARPGPHLP